MVACRGRAERLASALEPPCCERLLEAGVAAEQVGGRLRTDAPCARDSVGRVAAQCDEVRHLVGLDAVALDHSAGPMRERAAAALWLQDRRVLACELERVAVAARDERVTPLRLLLGDGRGKEVVGLVAIGLRDRESHRLAQLWGEIELLEQVGRELPAALVALEASR